MGLCIASGTTALNLAVSAFTLSWVHSVEHTAWEEDWRLHDGRLKLVEARIKGSGAGMEPPDGAILKGRWWHYQPKLEPLTVLHLADLSNDASEHRSTWRLCASGTCRSLTASGSDRSIVIRPCLTRDATTPTEK